MSELPYPEGTTFIELRDVHDGWSVAELPSGVLINRWPEDDRRYAATQAWIDAFSREPRV